MDSTTRYAYDGDDVALALSPAGSLTNRYLSGPAVDQVLADEDAAGNILWTLADHQGTVRDLADYDDGTGITAIANHLVYNSFGAITSETNPAVDELFSYTGREWDPDAGLYYYRARWYDPAVGRFLSEDPLGHDPDVNPYRYVHNDPATFTDPDGRQIRLPTQDNRIVVSPEWQGVVLAGNPSGNTGTSGRLAGKPTERGGTFGDYANAALDRALMPLAVVGDAFLTGFDQFWKGGYQPQTTPVQHFVDTVRQERSAGNSLPGAVLEAAAWNPIADGILSGPAMAGDAFLNVFAHSPGLNNWQPLTTEVQRSEEAYRNAEIAGYSTGGRVGHALLQFTADNSGSSALFRLWTGEDALTAQRFTTPDQLVDQAFEAVGKMSATASLVAPVLRLSPASRTLANTTRGWKVGDPINNLTKSGRVPSWSAVRKRFWKNEAHFNSSNYSQANLARMRQGLAPQRINPYTGQLESKELHHTPPRREGGLFDVRALWPDDHAAVDTYRRTGR